MAEWPDGKEFMAADNRTLLIFNQHGLPIDPDSTGLGGKTIRYESVEPKLEPDGSKSATIIFRYENTILRYNTGKNYDDASRLFFSDQIPMMIDLDMVKQANKLLAGKKLWIRSPLWYGNDGKRIRGRKFVPVIINDVQPGDIAFPLKIYFTDEKGNDACIFMNYGISGTETRLFSNLFYLSDIREKFPSITDENWNLICEGKVGLGMTKEECKLSIGNPNDVNSGHDYSQTLDLWQYPNGTALWFEDGIPTRFRL